MSILDRANIEAAASSVLNPAPVFPVVSERLDLLGLTPGQQRLQEYLDEFSRGYAEAIQAAVRVLFKSIEGRGPNLTWHHVASNLAKVAHGPQAIPIVIIKCEWDEFLCRWFFDEGWIRGLGRFEAAVLGLVKPSDEVPQMIHVLA